MTYFIQTSIYAALFYLVYLLFMKNRTAHNWSRAYLLINMAVPFILPLIHLDLFAPQQTVVNSFMLPVMTAGTELTGSAEKFSFLPVTYMSVSLLMFAGLSYQLLKLSFFIRRQKKEAYQNFTLLRATGMGPGSWFRYIFIPGEHADESIMKHELAHVQLGHSYDVILSRLALCLAWPNPMFWLIFNELKTVHEFQADTIAGNERTTYEQSLLNELFHTRHFALSHTFFHHPIKRRIMMLQSKARTGKMKALTLALLMATGMLYVQCAKDSTKNSIAAASQADRNGVYQQVDKLAEFAGESFLKHYVPSRLKYPEEAKAKKIEGVVMVQFLIDEKGKVQDTKVTSSPNEMLTSAALAALKDMPDWRPAEYKGAKVKSYYTLPISFRLDSKQPGNSGGVNKIVGFGLENENPNHAPVTIIDTDKEGC